MSEENKNEETPEKNGRDGSVITKNGDFSIYTLTVIGQIEGHYILPGDQKATKYEHLIPLLIAAEESRDIDGILIILNTVGGDVEAGLAIAEMIASLKKPTVSLVLGGGHSIGVPLAVSADRSFIVPTATMTLHPVRYSGLVIGAPQSFDYLEKMQERVIDFTASHSGISKDRLRSMIMSKDHLPNDIGMIIDGKTAVSEHLIDSIGGVKEAIAELKSRKNK